MGAVSKAKTEHGERLERLECEREQLLKSEINIKKYQRQALEIFHRMRKTDPVQQRQFLRQVVEKIEINPRRPLQIPPGVAGSNSST